MRTAVRLKCASAISSARDDHWPEGRYIVIEHQTPDILWQPDLLVHANGAKALVEALFAAPDPGPTRDRLARLANRPAVETPDGWRIDTDGGALTIMTLRRIGCALSWRRCARAASRDRCRRGCGGPWRCESVHDRQCD